MDRIDVRSIKMTGLFEFLEERDYIADEISDTLCIVKRSGEVPVYISLIDSIMYFYVDLGNVTGFADTELYFRILDLNTEILPVSIGIDSTRTNDNRLVIVESREVKNLDDNELLYIFNAVEIAVEKVQMILADYLD